MLASIVGSGRMSRPSSGCPLSGSREPSPGSPPGRSPSIRKVSNGSSVVSTASIVSGEGRKAFGASVSVTTTLPRLRRVAAMSPSPKSPCKGGSSSPIKGGPQSPTGSKPAGFPRGRPRRDHSDFNSTDSTWISSSEFFTSESSHAPPLLPSFVSSPSPSRSSSKDSITDSRLSDTHLPALPKRTTRASEPVISPMSRDSSGDFGSKRASWSSRQRTSEDYGKEFAEVLATSSTVYDLESYRNSTRERLEQAPSKPSVESVVTSDTRFVRGPTVLQTFEMTNQEAAAHYDSNMDRVLHKMRRLETLLSKEYYDFEPWNDQ